MVLYGILCSLPILYGVFREWTRVFNYWTDKGIPGPKPVIGFGNTIGTYMRPKSHIEMDWIAKYGKIYGVFDGHKPVLRVADPRLIRQILVTDFDVFTNRTLFKDIHPIYSQNLFTSDGPNWRRLRSLISPTFSSAKMRQMYEMMGACATQLSRVVDGYAVDCTLIDVKQVFGNFALDVLAMCAFVRAYFGI
ncbi:unnamed protein product [Oppiella nova]|uniref:Cytochrome P450 n=1 Tax=Oppiella nova TaxID=334625 RepID=A0A7R9MGL7_9ACAR|nr:unnamed protein product [Oppiella nova]CAG2177014.1 unnamed protein product [Oppiella nova]